MNRSGRFGAKGDTVNTTHKIKAATATLTVGFLLAIAFAATAQTAYGREGMTAQQRQAVLARAGATNRHYRLGVYSPGVAAVQRAENLRGQAMNRFYGLGTYSSAGTAAQRGEELRSQAMNRFYSLGAYSSTGPAVQRAVERRSQEINRFYGVGSYAVVSTSSPFDWSDAGIGAGGMLGLIVLAGGLTVLVRRRITGQPSSPSTT
jgi:hypothetical protein